MFWQGRHCIPSRRRRTWPPRLALGPETFCIFCRTERQMNTKRLLLTCRDNRVQHRSRSCWKRSWRVLGREWYSPFKLAAECQSFAFFFFFIFQNLGGYNSVLRPRVVGEWVGRAEEDADPLAAEMLHPPVPRAKIEVFWSGVGSPARRLVGHWLIFCGRVAVSVPVNNDHNKMTNTFVRSSRS